MSGKDRQIRICRVLLILNLCFIWGNSLLPGEVSGAFSDWVKGLLMKLFPMEEDLSAGDGLLRKLAHFTEFAMLGLLLGWLVRLMQKKRWYPLLWGVAAACVDETVQIFVPERGPSLRDVGIDSCGVLTGIVLLQTGYFLMRRKQRKKYGGK